MHAKISTLVRVRIMTFRSKGKKITQNPPDSGQIVGDPSCCFIVYNADSLDSVCSVSSQL